VSILEYDTFAMGTGKEAALKPLEEAAEAFAAWQDVDDCGSPSPCCEQCEVLNLCDSWANLADELADCIQACCNLADRHGIDLQAAMGRCRERNRARGRYGFGGAGR
jgi:NTP pyrophosphatase (non-canonical NTP hydrolase)